jgi:hypothetical protein
MPRKIVYIKADNLGFPTLDNLYPASKLLEEDIEIDGTQYIAGQIDPRYKLPEFAVLLLEDDGKNYYSILGDYTAAKIAKVDPDYEIKTNLDGNFTYTCLKYGMVQDLDRLLELGCPEYDPEVHTTYVLTNNIDTTGVPVSDISIRTEETTPKVDVNENTEE